MNDGSTAMTPGHEPGRGYHDIGGLDAGPVDQVVTEAKPWEKLSVALSGALGANGCKLVATDEVRRSREEMGAELYDTLGYFERGVESLRSVLVEKGLVSMPELEERMAQLAQRIRRDGR